MIKDFKLSGVYKITNKVNGKFYVGSGNSVFSRWLNHASMLSNKKHTNYKLQRAINKYGFENFSFEILEFHPPEGLNKKEQYYLDTLCKAQEYIRKESLYFNKNTYNIKPVVEGVAGLPMRDEAIIRAVRSRGIDSIYKVSDKGEFIKEYALQAHAAEENNISRSTVNNSVKNKRCLKDKDYYFVHAKSYDPNFIPKKCAAWNKGTKGVVKGHNTKVVYAYDVYGRFYRKFRSGVETAEFFNTDASSINRMIDNPKKKILHRHGVHLYNFFYEEQVLENRLEMFREIKEDGGISVYTLFDECVGHYSAKTIAEILGCHYNSISYSKNNEKILKGFYFI